MHYVIATDYDNRRTTAHCLHRSPSMFHCRPIYLSNAGARCWWETATGDQTYV